MLHNILVFFLSLIKYILFKSVNQYFIIINSRTLLTFIISLIVPFFAYKLNISYNIDLTLISIAIIFPVVFTVRGAFRRREKALEHISRFRGSMLTLENLFDENTKMEDDKKKIISFQKD